MDGEWEHLTLEEAGVKVIDCVHKTPVAESDGLPYVAIPQISNGRIDTTGARKISEADFKAWTKKALPEKYDVVLSRRCNPGVTAPVINNPTFALGQNLVLLRSDGEKLYPPFLRWLTTGPLWWNEVAKFENVGAVFNSLRCADIPSFRLPIPPMPEQRAIAHILGSLDDKIELNRQLNQTLEQMAQAIFKSWFIDFDPVVYNTVHAGNPVPERFQAAAERYRQTPDIQTLPQHILDLFPDRFEDSELGEIPAGWEAVPLEQVIDVNPKRTLRKGTVATYLDMKNMPTEGMRPTDWWDREFKSGSRFINGDTLVARITPCLENGKTAFVNFLQEGEVCWGSTEYIVLRSKALLPNEYSYFLARESGFRDHAIANMTGSSGRQRVPASAISSYPVIKAEPLVYKEFSRQVSPIAERIKEQDDENRTLSSLRDTLLPKLISGELRIPNIEENSEVDLCLP